MPTKQDETTKTLVDEVLAEADKSATEEEKPKSADDSVIDALMKYIHDPLDISPYTKAVLYGDIGSGKTAAACQAPNPILLAIERGQSTIYNHPEVIRNGIKVMDFKSVKQVEDLAAQAKKGNLPWETYIVDTFSELQDTALDNRVEHNYWLAPNKRDLYTPEGKDFQGNTGHMRRIAAIFRDIDAHVVFVCHDRDDEKGPSKSVVRGPSLTNKIAKALNQYVDVIAYMWNEVDNEGEETFNSVVRPIQTLEARITAKTRIKSLPTHIENLTFNMMIEAKAKQIEELKKAMNK